MDLYMRLNKLEARAKRKTSSFDLFAQIRRYEAIFEAIKSGSPLDIEDPDVKTCLDCEPYFAELEAMRSEAG